MQIRDNNRINPAQGMRIVRNGIQGTIARTGFRPNGVRHTDVLWDNGQFEYLSDNQLSKCQAVEDEESDT